MTWFQFILDGNELVSLTVGWQRLTNNLNCYQIKNYIIWFITIKTVEFNLLLKSNPRIIFVIFPKRESTYKHMCTYMLPFRSPFHTHTPLHVLEKLSIQYWYGMYLYTCALMYRLNSLLYILHILFFELNKIINNIKFNYTSSV